MHLTSRMSLGMTLAFAFHGDAHFYPQNAFNFKNANGRHCEIAFCVPWIVREPFASETANKVAICVRGSLTW